MSAPAARAAWPLLGKRGVVRMRVMTTSRSGSWTGRPPRPRSGTSWLLAMPALPCRYGASHAGGGVAGHRADERVRTRGIDRERASGRLAALRLDFDGAGDALGEGEVVG